MRYIQVRLQAPDAHSEFLEENGENDALIVESIIGEALLEVFDSLFIESVTVQYFPEHTNAAAKQDRIECENV